MAHRRVVLAGDAGVPLEDALWLALLVEEDDDEAARQDAVPLAIWGRLIRRIRLTPVL